MIETSQVARGVLYYTQILGLRVFPLHDVVQGHCSCELASQCPPARAGKHPRIEDWQREASKGKLKIRKWWERWPDANIGIPTGRINNFFVIDIDPQNGGWIAYQDCLAGHIPPTYSPTTGSEGQHLWFKYPEGEDLTNKNKFPRGLDVRANGGFVVAAPSVSLKGNYAWPDHMLGSIDDLAECPPHIIEQYLRSDPHEEEFVNQGSTQEYDTLSEDEQARISRYVDEAFNAELDSLEDLDEDDEWDAETFKISCRIFELVKAPWSPLTYEKAVKGIIRSAPDPDGEGWTVERINQKIKSAWQRVSSHDLVRPFPEKPSTPELDPEPSRLILVPFADMEPEPYEWHEKNLMPKKGVVVLAGSAGTGKSTLLCYYFSKFTSGEWGNRDGNALYLAGTEDSLKDVVKPRLIAAKADVSRIFTAEMQVKVEDEIYNRRTIFKQDLLALKRTVRDHNIKMICMDPANTFLGIDEEKDSYSEIRLTLEKVVQFADETDCLVVLIKHFKKNQTMGPQLDAMSRLFGSVAWSEVVRHVLVLRKVDDEIRERKGLDIDDPVAAILSVEKNSYGPTSSSGLPPIGFSRDEVKVTIGKLKDEPQARFTCLGDRRDLNDLDSVAVMTEEQVDKRIKDEDSAKEWLIETLQGFGGRQEITEMKRIHSEDDRIGVSWRTLLRKADQLGIKSEKIEGAGKNKKEWILPDELMPDPNGLKM